MVMGRNLEGLIVLTALGAEKNTVGAEGAVPDLPDPCLWTLCWLKPA